MRWEEEIWEKASVEEVEEVEKISRRGGNVTEAASQRRWASDVFTETKGSAQLEKRLGTQAYDATLGEEIGEITFFPLIRIESRGRKIVILRWPLM